MSMGIVQARFSPTSWLYRSVQLNAKALQISSAFMAVAALLLPLIPGHGIVICPLRLMVGIPCPFCGMTTSVVATSRGRFSEAVAANPAGILAVVAAIAILLLRPKRVRIPVSVAALTVTAMWAWELFRFDVL
jgi:hypothetical protein